MYFKFLRILGVKLFIQINKYILYSLERLSNKTAVNVKGLMPIKDTNFWNGGFLKILVCVIYWHICGLYTSILTILTPNTLTNLTPRQETMSPAIAGARKFFFNSSDPNLYHVSISLRVNHQEKQVLSTCRPQHLVKHCNFCKVKLFAIEQ